MTDDLLLQIIDQNNILNENLIYLTELLETFTTSLFLVLGVLIMAVLLPKCWERMWRHG